MALPTKPFKKKWIRYCCGRFIYIAAYSCLGDGLDDIVCVASNGDASMSLNLGDGSGTKPPTFKSMGLIKTNEGHAQNAVRLGDIDGDGRGDYGVVIDGATWWYRNGGIGNTPSFWQPLGQRAGYFGVTDTDTRGVRYEDINGDGRDDWMWVSDTGTVTTWTAAESCLVGVPGDVSTSSSSSSSDHRKVIEKLDDDQITRANLSFLVRECTFRGDKVFTKDPLRDQHMLESALSSHLPRLIFVTEFILDVFMGNHKVLEPLADKTIYLCNIQLSPRDYTNLIFVSGRMRVLGERR